MRGFRRDNQKAREAEMRQQNEWIVSATHGGYGPNVRCPHGWIRRGCPGCARDRYETGPDRESKVTAG